MKIFSFGFNATTLFLALLGLPAIQSQAAPAPWVFAVTNSATSSSYLFIDNARINNDSDAVVIATQKGFGYNNHPFGLYYNDTLKKWVIYNEDNENIPSGTAFSIMALHAPTPRIFLSVASGLNSFDDSTTISAQGLNNNTNGLVLVTHLYNPHNRGGMYDTNYLGVLLNENKWNIYHENGNEALATTYNVANITGMKEASVQIATAANIAYNNGFVLSGTNSTNPNAIVFATHNYTASDYQVHNHPIGAGFLGGHWIIYNADGYSMATKEAFNVMIFPGPQ